jgi:hypothetical protein
MQRVLLDFAALAAIGAIGASTPAQGRDTLAGRPTAPADRFGAGPFARGDLCRDDRRDRDGDRRRFDHCRSDVVMDWYGGEWAFYNNRTFEPDSYNGWWHDRPDRAYPAWMRHNQDCQRQWFSGDVLRC